MAKDDNILQKKKKILSAILRGITSNYHSGFYCLDWLHSFATESRLETYKKYFKKDFCNKAPFIIYADLEFSIDWFLIEQIEVKRILKIYLQQK